MRIAQIIHMKAAEGESKVYPHKFFVSISFSDYVEKYSHLKNEEVHDDHVSIAGKKISKLFLNYF